MSAHATQVFLHSPQALRIELRLDDAALLLWWSPRAGISSDALERNYSNRDDHLEVFERIQLEDTELGGFRSCDYDAYRAVLHFANREIELATVPDLPVVLVTARRSPLGVRFKTHRHDTRTAADARGWTVRHEEGGRAFEFTATVGSGTGKFQHQPIFEPGRAVHARADLAEGQTLAIGVGLDGDGIASKTASLVCRPLDAIHADTAARLARDLADGTPVFRNAPDLDRFYALNRRSLHGATDDSGALRAALKEVYYLIWVRDGAFCFNYQAATGWMHKHLDWCRLLLANPLTIGPEEPMLPPGRTFGQLVARRFGKMEEDGPYYVAWSIFTAWVQSGDDTLLKPENLTLLEDMVRWVEAYDFDEARGLFRERMVDESPYKGSRDDGWDAANGQLQREGGMKYQGKHILYSYSAYMNVLMFGTYGMLAALPGIRQADAYRAKAECLWAKLAPFLPQEGLPPAGELVMEDGEVIYAPPYIPKTACYLWAFSLPGLAPIPNIDALRIRLMRDVLARPRGHWINAITALIAAVDPLTCDEQELARGIHYLVAQGQRSGKYLPMPGTIPEKYDAPDGAYYDDIRPQAFAQSSFLAACTSLGVRRLPFGLAVRPTRFLEKLSSYAWRESRIDFVFGTAHEGVQIDGKPLSHSLQLPADALRPGRVTVTIGSLPDAGALARSNVNLLAIRTIGDEVIFDIEAPGLSELAFTRQPKSLRTDGATVDNAAWSEESGLAFYRFSANGKRSLCCRF